MTKTQLDVQKNISLAPLTSFKIGGRAKYFIRVDSPKKLLAALDWAQKRKLDFKIFGNGTNLIFPDKNLNCLVIQSQGGEIKQAGQKLIADSGAQLAKLITRAIHSGLAGLEKLAGIPGTLGGAIVGNAGAFGRSISDSVLKVQIWDNQKTRWLTKKECRFDYRESIFKHQKWLILKAVLKLKRSQSEKLEKIHQQILLARTGKWDPQARTVGCFFKNVLVKEIDPKALKLIDRSKIIDNKISAGWLLDQVGAKQVRVGQAQVADFHANFIINTGKAKAKEIKKLASQLKQKVKNKFGISLQEEVRYF
jgi:UDP-N-acetylmuramate dehydrogenase